MAEEPLCVCTINLKPGKQAGFNRKHHWIFSGAIFPPNPIPAEGDLVQIADSTGALLGFGFYGTGSIAVRVLSFEPTNKFNEAILLALNNALQLRNTIPNLLNNDNAGWRCIHGEGDGLSGLIVDCFGTHVVLQYHHKGWEQFESVLFNFFNENLSFTPSTIVVKLPARGNKLPVRYLKGNTSGTFIKESGVEMYVDWEKGQKTGFFLDQRDNRHILAQFAKGKSVLNMFCYTGGFSLAALSGGADKVVSIDSSNSAIQICNETVQRLNPNAQHTGLVNDAIDWLKNNSETFDIVVCDPPAFAKSTAARHNAIQAYIRLNTLALQRVKKGGFLFTFSCSQVIETAQFQQALVSAGLAAQKKIKRIRPLSQPSDHPVNLYHPETAYLKGLLLHVS